MNQQWDPRQYDKFRDERLQPALDLMAMVEPRDGMKVVDLGCGGGEITAMLAERFPASHVLGLDSSVAMLEQAASRAHPSLEFRQQSIEEFDGYRDFDLVFSNAAMQWVPDHEGWLRRMLPALPSGAQVAVQVPRNEEHPSHHLAERMAAEEPYRSLLGGFVRKSNVLPLERYAELLARHGLSDVICMEKVYLHELTDVDAVVEWVKGTMLAAYLSRLQGAAEARFLDDYRQRLRAELGNLSPYLYTFRRLFFYARNSAG